MSHAPLDGLDRVLDVAQETAASVDRDARFPQETVAALAASGLLGLTVPESVGGAGGGPAEFVQTTRALAARCASSAMIYLMHVCAAQVTLAGTPSARLRGPARPGVDGSNLSTLAFSERGSRSHFWAPVCQIAGGRITRAEVVRHERGAREDATSSRPVPRAPTSPHRVLASTWSTRMRRLRWSTSVPRGIGPRAARQRERADDARHGRRRTVSLLGEDGQGPRPHARRRPALVPARLRRRSRSGSPRARSGATVAHVTGAQLEHLGQTLVDLPTVRARIGQAQTEVDAIAGFLADLARRMSRG